MVFANVALTLLNCLLALPSCFDPERRCLNGGVCVTQNKHKDDSAMCSCLAGYGGLTCEKIVDVCEAYPHYCNDGTCVNVNGTPACHCSTGYFGRNCEYTFDKCNLGNICKNDGTCVDDICFCVDGFSGELCERHVPERDDYLRGGCEEHPEFCALRFADGVCNQECNNAKCFFDGFDCVVSAPKCRFADYCVLHYMDGKCDLQCAVAECGFDGFDCGGNTNVYLADSSIVGIIFDGSPVKILERIYPLLGKLAQKLYAPVLLAFDVNNGSRIYEWSFDSGVGKRIDVRGGWKMSSNATGVLLYAHIDVAFCELRLHLNKTNNFPCFIDVFGAVAYLHTALYEPVYSQMSLGGVRIEELFVEDERSRPLPLVGVVVMFSVSLIATVFCVYGIYELCGILRKKNIIKARAPLWKVPLSPNSDVTGWSTMPCFDDYQPMKDVSLLDGLPPLTKRFSSSASCGRKHCYEASVMSRSDVSGSDEQQHFFTLDSYFHDSGNADHYLGPDLLKAVKCSDVKAVSFLVLHGADVNCSDSVGNTALHHSVMVNNDQIIRLLLGSRRCNLSAVNILGQTALTLTVKFAHVSDLCARCILDFMYAEHRRHTKSPISTFVPVQYSSLPRNAISQPMFIASGDIQQFDPAMKQFESYSYDCLFSRNILSEKDDPSLVDVFGRTALHYAALNNRLEVLPTLYAYGLKLDTQDSKGETPLYLAAREGHLGAVDLLLSFGAKKYITNQIGQTPLDIACEKKHYSVMRLLDKATANCVDDIIHSLKQKRKSIQPNSGSCEREGSQTLLVTSPESSSLSSSSITIHLNGDYPEDVDDDENMVISSALLNSVTSFVLTPPEQILAEAEEIDPARLEYTNLSTSSCLPSEFLQNNATNMGSFQVVKKDETLNRGMQTSGKFVSSELNVFAVP